MPDAVAVPAESAEALAASGPVATGTGLTGDWIALVDTLKDSLGAKARLLAQNAELVAREGELVRLRRELLQGIDQADLEATLRVIRVFEDAGLAP